MGGFPFHISPPPLYLLRQREQTSSHFPKQLHGIFSPNNKRISSFRCPAAGAYRINHQLLHLPNRTQELLLLPLTRRVSSTSLPTSCFCSKPSKTILQNQEQEVSDNDYLRLSKSKEKVIVDVRWRRKVPMYDAQIRIDSRVEKTARK